MSNHTASYPARRHIRYCRLLARSLSPVAVHATCHDLTLFHFATREAAATFASLANEPTRDYAPSLVKHNKHLVTIFH